MKRKAKPNPRHKSRRTAPRRTPRTRGVVAQSQKPTYVIETQRDHAGITRNPTNRTYRRAVKLFRDFHGEHPKYVDEWTVSVPTMAMQVGKVTGILYKARMDGKEQEFLHEFSGQSRPTLAASADGTQLLLLGGTYRFTERGIVDGTADIER